MTTEQNNTAALTDEQLEWVAGGRGGENPPAASSNNPWRADWWERMWRWKMLNDYCETYHDHD